MSGHGIILAVLTVVGLTAPAMANPNVAGDEPAPAYFPDLKRAAASDYAAAAAETGKPIIWVVVDALRPDNMSAYGYERDTTPNLTKFADEGILFTRFFANAPWTRPATATMLSGLIPSGHRMQCDWHSLPADVSTVAEQMKKAGYTTIGVVANGNASSAFGLDRGFDIYEDTVKNWKGLPNARQVFQLGMKHLKKHRGKKKVFLFLFVVDPHDPYRPKPPYDKMYYPEYKGEVRHKVHWEYKNDYPEAQGKKVVALYDGLIRYTDDQLGWLFARLKKMGFWDEASIFITADHGESFGEHGLYLHGHHHYETHLRIPLIVRAPWIKKEERGRYSSAFLQQIDLGPTFIGLAGGQPAPAMRGLNIAKVLVDRTIVPVPRYVISEYKCYGIRRSAIRTRRYKLIYQQPAVREVFNKHIKDPKLLPSVSFDKEVFDLFEVLADPHETRNLWNKPGTHPVGAKLLKVLKDEILQDEPSRRVRDLDPDLVEELRSLGYMQ